MIEHLLLPLVSERFKNEEHYRNGHIHILSAKPGTVILGVHTPEMKQLAKTLAAASECKNTLEEFSKAGKPADLAHEERMVWGLMLDYIKCPLEERLNYITTFLPFIDNWAICDNFCCNSKWAEKGDKEVFWKYLVKLGKSGEEFTVRVMLIMAMCHFLDDKNMQRTFATLDSLGFKEDEPYYIRMGAAWLLATALAKNPDKTREFVNSCSLPKDILKLYVRKARESRITKTTSAF